ncbi:MAG TPA: sulfotransferase family 2 domain-containing protein [Sphingomicrobium sp.]|nr:sulfotransferase family 2 domain-containing protein [Sphingomicrobium sp.]
MKHLFYKAPGWAQRAMLVRARAPAWLDAGVLFVHIPKAAGTSISLALYDRFLGHVRASDVRKWGSASVRALPRFAVTRNPWDRLVSAWRFAARGSGIGGGFQAGIWRPEQYRVSEFETFERFVTDWLAKRDVSRLDPVFQPQSLFVRDRDGKIIVDHLGKVEDLGPTLDFLERTVGTRPALGRSNRSGEPVAYRDHYTPDLAAMVGQIYAGDIDLLGYEFES